MIITLQIREGHYYADRILHRYSHRILAVAEKRPDGTRNCPVIDFFQEQGDRLEKLRALIEITARKGPPDNREKFKSVERSGGILEFKAFQHRLLCFHDEGNQIICTNGLVKKSDSLPPAAIKTAQRWKDLYFAAKNSLTLRHEPEHP